MKLFVSFVILEHQHFEALESVVPRNSEAEYCVPCPLISLCLWETLYVTLDRSFSLSLTEDF